MDSGVGVCAVRLSRVTSDGTPDFGNAHGSLTICGGIMKLSDDWEVEDGVEQFVRDSCGNVVVNRRKPDTTKYATWELTMTKDDPRVAELMELGTIVGSLDDPSGVAWTAGRGCSPVQPNGFIMEAWQERIDCDDAADFPFYRIIYGRAYARPGARDRDENPQETVYQGISVVNDNFGDGPFGDLDDLTSVTDWPMAEMFDVGVPECDALFTYHAIPGSAS